MVELKSPNIRFPIAEVYENPTFPVDSARNHSSYYQKGEFERLSQLLSGGN